MAGFSCSEAVTRALGPVVGTTPTTGRGPGIVMSAPFAAAH